MMSSAECLAAWPNLLSRPYLCRTARSEWDGVRRELPPQVNGNNFLDSKRKRTGGKESM
jgi:hypothetical protein